MKSLPQIVFDRATFVRPGGEVLFRQLSWTIREGETWAVVGPVGSGKTALIEAILGRLHLTEGEIGWPFIERLRANGRAINRPAEVIQRVSFKEESRLFSYGQHYYQQRFNFIEPEDDLTLDAFLRSGTSAADDAIRELAARFGIEGLGDLSLIKLSNGQIRRARIVRALLSQPELLILDEPFMGLDATGRREIADILGHLVERGTRIVLITRPESIPAWVTHVLELDSLAIRRQGPRSPFAVSEPGDVIPRSLATESRTESPAIIEFHNVNVSYADRSILKDVSWTVRAGERWALLGPNGSGKTTLLSLISGDHPQAYSNDIRLFGRRRGSGETIWDIKRNIGLVSPELHLYFTEPLTAFQAAATGFFDVLAYRKVTPEREIVVRDLFDRFGLSPLSDRYFARLSTGEQRLVLLVRALVKQPPVLILDEPFQGLDSRIVHQLLDWLDGGLRPDQTLIFVSHYEDEIPRTVNRRLRLEEGRVVERWPAENEESALGGVGNGK